MNIRGIIIGTTVGLLVGGSTLGGAQAAGEPDLSCATVPDCQVVIKRLYDDGKTLGAEVNDLRRIRVKQERRIHRLEKRVERLTNRR